MPDLLVPLYKLPGKFACSGFTVRKPMAFESATIQKWIAGTFSESWASEVLPALCRTPSTMLIAVEESSGKLAGFCAWDCTALGFLGPVGVSEEFRGTGLGRTVTLEVLYSMREQGYGYSVVGAAGPVEFFTKICNASAIPGSTPGIYPKPVL